MVRRYVIKGISALALIVVISIVFSSLVILPTPSTTYTKVDSSLLVKNPSNYEGHRISFAVEISEAKSELLYSVVEGFDILFEEGPVQLGIGSHLLIRGISLIESEGHVVIEEYHISDDWNPLIRSIPGLVIFLLIFFSAFKLSYRELIFTPRRGD